MAGGCTSGTCTSASICRPSTSATSISCCSSCAPPTIRPRPTASSTAWSAWRTSSSSIWTWYSDGDKWAVKKVIEIPAEPANEDAAAAAAQGLQGRAAARHRHRPVDGRPVPLRLLLGHGRPAAVRRVRPVQPQADRQSEDRRHRLEGHASRRQERRAQRRPANGGDQPRRSSASTSPTRSMAPSTRSSIPTASRAGW